ncbi:MAG: RluA family pseudouridine synthase [Alphaproteobacteria bacterium]|nr:RluA family pseudouridine synthase [Alphaproteobacteria bacterium]
MDSPTLTVSAAVREQLSISWSKAKQLCTEGRVTVDGKRCLDPARLIHKTNVVAVDRFAPKVEKGPLSREAIVYADKDFVVCNKPAGMLSVADVEGNKDTLADHMRTLLRRVEGKDGHDVPLGVVHRIDRDTSGLIVFTRSPLAHRMLAEAFQEHDIERLYHGIAHGEVHEERVETSLLLDRGDGLRGSFGYFRRSAEEPPEDAKRSVTFIKPLESLNGATLVECRLHTGRQHQIRIHLSELGHPLVGEKVYIREYTAQKIEAGRTMLHARMLSFAHPRTGKAMNFERPPPEDMAAIAARLRGKQGL